MALRHINKLVLVSTTRAGERGFELERLLESVEKFAESYSDICVLHYILVQGVSDGNREPVSRHSHLRISSSSNLLSLSSARNVLLAEIFNSDLLDRAVVCFPDDDAWYPDGLLLNIVGRFSDHAELDLWICRSGPSPMWPHSPNDQPLRVQELISNGTSNTLFIRGELVRTLGSFDEALGLGTPAKSGEDTDYGLRAFRKGRYSAFVDAVAVGHRAFDQRDRILYFSGALYAIARHAPFVRGGYVALGRKCIVGCFWFVLGQLSFKELASSLGGVIRIWRAGQV